LAKAGLCAAAAINFACAADLLGMVRFPVDRKWDKQSPELVPR
jgi:hypothetical protein